MILNVSFDQSVGSLPAGLIAAVNYVVNYFDALFTNNVTVNIDLGYGEIDGQPLEPNAAGESQANLVSISYQQAVGALQSEGQLGSSTLPTSSPFDNGTLLVTTAQEKALGLLAGNSSEIDGWVGISNTVPFSYSANTPPAAGQYYLIGVLEHEITEDVGRESYIAADIGGSQSYSIMDLYRFSAANVHQLGTGSPAYFSIDNGSTNLNSFNTNPSGDLGDLQASAGADAFLAFSPPGQIENMSAADLIVMNAIGWDTGNVTASNTTIPTASNTTMPAVAVEATMYGAVGPSAEVNKLATDFLPAQLAYAAQNGLNPQVYACQALGLALAFGNENGSTAFANAYGPDNPSMSNSASGDAAFSAAAAAVIFGSAETAHIANVIDTWVNYWKAFYTTNGIPGMSNVTAVQIDLAARGAAWGDAVGIALANNTGPLLGETSNFLSQVAQGTAVYSAPLTSQLIESAPPIIGISSHLEHGIGVTA